MTRSALVGCLALLAGGAAWLLGIEFERMWLRAYEAPLEGEGPARDELGPPSRSPHGSRRRWVSNHHPRLAPSATGAS